MNTNVKQPAEMVSFTKTPSGKTQMLFNVNGHNVKLLFPYNSDVQKDTVVLEDSAINDVKHAMLQSVIKQ